MLLKYNILKKYHKTKIFNNLGIRSSQSVRKQNKATEQEKLSANTNYLLILVTFNKKTPLGNILNVKKIKELLKRGRMFTDTSQLFEMVT